MSLIRRPKYFEQLEIAIGRSPITALLGPRQAGKTTLARMYAENKHATYFDLEYFPDRQRLQNPEYVLGGLYGVVVFDEIQTMPELVSLLRVQVDRPENKSQYLILGSASPNLMRKVSESLAGRVEFVDLTGFNLFEVNRIDQQRLWVRGGFPRSFLAESDTDSIAWREGFLRTFLERDIPQLGLRIPAVTIRRFWSMLAHYHGQTWNASALARSMGLSNNTIRSYLDILTGTFMVRQLPPWFVNIKKRQVKSPKVFIRDSGILHHLLNISDFHTLMGHPVVGASWEGFVLEQVFSVLQTRDLYYWATYEGAELDLLFFHGGESYGIEIKFSSAPKVTKSMRIALRDLNLGHLWVIHTGSDTFPVDDKITFLSLPDLGLISEFLLS
jgi:predicted AAA+ superfamily ATPase